MVRKKYKVMSIEEDVAVRIQDRAMKEGKTISTYLDALLLLYDLGKEREEDKIEEIKGIYQHTNKEIATRDVLKEELRLAIKGLEADIGEAVREAAKEAIRDLKR